jgi:hypothetical protein
MLWEHKAKLCDTTSEARRVLNEVDFQPRVSKVECGAHPADAAADHEDGCGSSAQWR